MTTQKESKVRAALCSFGMSGKLFHAPFIHLHPGLELYACWERSSKNIQSIYPGVISYDTYEEMLEDPSIDLVIINTPNYTHYDFAKQALAAGKHVVVEKPFTITVQEADELIALARQQNRIISVYQNRRYDSDYKTIKKVLEEGLLGEIVEAEFHFDRFVEVLSYKNHKETPGPGTGSLYDLGSHIIDQALQLFGWPLAIFADITIMRPISKVDDFFELLFYYENKRVRLRSTYVARETIPGYVIHGNKGSFLKPKTNVQEIALLNGLLPQGENWGKEEKEEWGLLHTEKDGKVTREYIPSVQGRYMDYYEGIYQAVANGQPAPVSAEDGKKVITIIQAAFKSVHEKRVIEL